MNGVPLLDLAKHALGAAKAYSVSKPVNVQAIVTTQAALYAQALYSGMQLPGGAASPEYVVTLRGRFTCGSCGTATPTSTTTTSPSSVRVSTMVLQLPVPLTIGDTTGVAVGVALPIWPSLDGSTTLIPTSSRWPGSRFRLARTRLGRRRSRIPTPGSADQPSFDKQP